MTTPRHPVRYSVLLGVGMVTLTFAAGLGAGEAVHQLLPVVPESDAEVQGLVAPPDDNDNPLANSNGDAPVAVAPPVAAQPVIVPRVISRPTHHTVRIRTRSS